jgi:hypothetical protein
MDADHAKETPSGAWCAHVTAADPTERIFDAGEPTERHDTVDSSG